MWNQVSTTRRYLQKGYSTVTLRDGDFYFCYFLWFENETVRNIASILSREVLGRGKHKVTLSFFIPFCYGFNKGFKLEAGEIPVLPDDTPPIGMFAWDYYR